MKFKGMKRFLSGTLALVMAMAGMTIGMATSAMAADYTYGSVTLQSSQVKEWGFTTNMPTGSNQALADGDTVNEITFVSVSDGANLNKSNYLSAKAGVVFNVPVPVNSTGNIYVQATSGNAARNVSFKDGTETKTLIMNTSTTGNSATFTASATENGYIQLTAAGGECKIGLIQITLDDGFSFGTVTEYTWALDLSGLTSVDGTGLALGDTTTTTLGNSLSYTGTGYTLKSDYENITTSTTGVTFNEADNTITVKPTDDWFDVVAPKTYVSVEPTESGDTVVYNFVQSDDSEKYLVSATDTTKSATTAYTEFAGTDGNDVDNYVSLSTAGAKLYDDSTTAATRLVVPVNASTGKLTVSGTVTPTNNIGGKWKLVDLDCVSVSTDSAKNLVITGDNQQSYTDNAGAAVKNQTITYTVTVDYAAQTASGSITNGTTTKEFADVAFAIDSTSKDTITTTSGISFITNNGNSVSAGNDRGLLIPSVTVKVEGASGPVVTKQTAANLVGVITDGTTSYAVSVVSASDVSKSSVEQVAGTTTIANSDTVYNMITLGENTYSAVDFGGAEGDYVFASIIENDNATAAATVLTNILTVQTVLS